MTEVEAIVKLDEALSGLADESERQRVLDWAVAKFGSVKAPSKVVVPKAVISGAPETLVRSAPSEGEMAGVALMSDSGEFKLTVRDLKASSTNDAAVRISLVSIYAYCSLSGETSASSKKIVKPSLEEWRAYTGNTRKILAAHKGIVRNGDALSLDQHAKREAEEYIDQILNEDLKGSWNPSGSTKKKSSVRNSSEEGVLVV